MPTNGGQARPVPTAPAAARGGERSGNLRAALRAVRRRGRHLVPAVRGVLPRPAPRRGVRSVRRRGRNLLPAGGENLRRPPPPRGGGLDLRPGLRLARLLGGL